MSITIDDIRRALLKGGDVSFLQGILRKALKKPPLEEIAADPTVFLKQLNSQLSEAVEGWIDGKPLPGKKQKSRFKIFLQPVVRYGRKISAFIEETIDTFKPDVVLLDTSPVTGLGAGNFYAFSLHNMLGLPLPVKTISSEGTLLHKSTFLPGKKQRRAKH